MLASCLLLSAHLATNLTAFFSCRGIALMDVGLIASVDVIHSQQPYLVSYLPTLSFSRNVSLL